MKDNSFFFFFKWQILTVTSQSGQTGTRGVVIVTPVDVFVITVVLGVVGVVDAAVVVLGGPVDEN